MKCAKRVLASLVALVMVSNIAFGYTVTVSNGIYTIERTGMVDGKEVTIKANKTAGAEFEVKGENTAGIVLNQSVPEAPLATFTMPAADVEIGISTTPVNAPCLGEGMYPVNWNEKTNEWLMTTEDSWEWDYGNVASVTSNGKIDGYRVGKWANAMTADGSMYVWIPRYTYKILSGEHQKVKSWNSDLVEENDSELGKISIRFSKDLEDDTKNGYKLHPAFEFGGKGITGFWVAKFEASRDDATENSEGRGTIPTSVPGVKAWTDSSASQMYTAAYEMNRTLDSHMMKNSEWGAVAYLTNAIGRIPYINNSDSFITGKSGENEDSYREDGLYWDLETGVHETGTSVPSYDWNEAGGVKASTTHNIYGVYDMSGGVHDTVAAIYLNASATYLADASETEYAGALYANRNTAYVETYDGYNASEIGDAIYETSANNAVDTLAWDNAYSNFFNDYYGAVLVRGVSSSANSFAGIFGASSYSGENGFDAACGFRVVLIPPEAVSARTANAPVLADGMVPLNWNGTKWVDTNEDEWIYNYDTVANEVSNGTVSGNGAGQWANARLADGSIYVWIPRYTYKIESGENKNVISWNSDSITGSETEVGKIKIRWSNGIVDLTDGGYMVHPSFNYAQYLGGDTSDPNNYNTSTVAGVTTPLTDADKLEGFWVAKYEASSSDAIVAGEPQLLKMGTTTGIQTQRYETSGNIIEVSAGAMAEYEFISWSVSGITVEDTTQPTFSFMMPNNTVELIANYRTQGGLEVAVSFETYGGTPVTAKTVSVGNVYGTLTEPTRTGYTFNDWYKEPEFINKINAASIVGTTTNHTLYAKWQGKQYVVTFNSNGGSTVENRVVTFGNDYGTLSTPTKTGYQLEGWYLEDTFTNKVTETTKVTIANNHTLYAKWEDAEFNVTLDNQGATTAGTTSVTATYGHVMPEITKPEKTGYTFDGYYAEANGSGTKYYNADGTSARNYDLLTNTTLYANWTANNYTVTLDDQAATTAGVGSVQAEYGSAMQTLPTLPTKTGYTFDGYYAEANGSGTKYYNEDGTSAEIMTY